MHSALLWKPRKIFAFLSIIGFSLVQLQQAQADSYKNYDENVVRAYKTAKIGSISPHIVLPADSDEEAVNTAISHYLSNTHYFTKHKSEIFLIDAKKVNSSLDKKEVLSIDRLYSLKNPEKFIFAFNKSQGSKELFGREKIADSLASNPSEYAIVAKKIDNYNLPLPWKMTKMGYNGVLNTIILVPKFGFGYIINPPFRWIKANKPEHIYNNISSEVEKITTGQRPLLRVKCFKAPKESKSI